MRVLVCFQVTQIVTFILNMVNFKFNFLSQRSVQLESLNVHKFFLP